MIIYINTYASYLFLSNAKECGVQTNRWPWKRLRNTYYITINSSMETVKLLPSLDLERELGIQLVTKEIPVEYGYVKTVYPWVRKWTICDLSDPHRK
ncbi:putative Pyroglutamyl-peptidase 1 pyroglutamyl-peptidase I pyrrolidone-carboxylate peptidase pgp-I pyroglutamyl aminopeptidase I PAP-I [Daphnia magna]|uniref:Putative Pyroglutamyl-peptidase 1 pyroglutamyl-peptidase I pyrrolidone-carboxylate peptidase pgp-I pyroglutamyl aminopeptidase I PAP-I n=1 Tax=Daphnia magna TaxID=35525 RepID=A0A164YQ11_9CRUS|nr:putative Pyroglutamyl-peptidase 1 pyroglutamyl-peptidase I pyrrolidone-carboxylate peptidase pgp-I pyroglutamyl aminopeptidase I PAP-I [Daphnia magna]